MATVLPGCRSRAFNVSDADTRAVRPDEIPGRFVILAGKVTGLHAAGARLMGVTTTILFGAEDAARAGCAAEPGEGPGVSKESTGHTSASTQGSAKGGEKAREEYPGWQLTPSGELRFLARSRVSMEAGSYETHVPTRLGRILDRCRFRPRGGLTFTFEALTADGRLVTFSHEVPVEELRAGFSMGGTRAYDFAWPGPKSFLTTRSSATELVPAPGTASFADSAASSPAGASFADVRGHIEATRENPGPLATEPGLPTSAIGVGIVGNALGVDMRDERVRADQTRVLVSRSDVRESTTKSFHPFGVCTFARWKTAPDSPWSGLFAAGVDRPVVVRFSGAGNNTTTKADFGLVHRMLGLAVKIFPASTPETKVETANLLLFDDAGPWGNKSPWYLFNDENANSLFFTNWIYGLNLPTVGTLNSFGRLVFEPRHAPLTRLALVKADGRFETPALLKTPFLVRVQYAGKKRSGRHTDLRSELLSYEADELAFDVFVYPEGTDPVSLKGDAKSQRGVGAAALAPVARIEGFSKPFVSSYCEKDLQFAHTAH